MAGTVWPYGMGMKTTIRVGRVDVLFQLRADEGIYEDDANEQQFDSGGGFIAEALECGKWLRLGTYRTYAEAAKAIYIERPDYSAAVGAP